MLVPRYQKLRSMTKLCYLTTWTGCTPRALLLAGGYTPMWGLKAVAKHPEASRVNQNKKKRVNPGKGLHIIPLSYTLFYTMNWTIELHFGLKNPRSNLAGFINNADRDTPHGQKNCNTLYNSIALLTTLDGNRKIKTQMYFTDLLFILSRVFIGINFMYRLLYCILITHHYKALFIP